MRSSRYIDNAIPPSPVFLLNRNLQESATLTEKESIKQQLEMSSSPHLSNNVDGELTKKILSQKMFILQTTTNSYNSQWKTLSQLELSLVRYGNNDLLNSRDDIIDGKVGRYSGLYLTSALDYFITDHSYPWSEVSSLFIMLYNKNIFIYNSEVGLN